jgi:two-component system, chemotaxis family, chemotaxis protein CheY
METPSISSAPNAAATPTARRPLRILYADDLYELRELARISFGRDGHGIECHEDGAQALAQIDADSAYDLVITDHHMPNLNGLEFVTKLRERHFPGKIMVFSSELSETVARQYREKNIDRILYKPIIPSNLRKIIGELFPVSAPAVA